MDLLFLLAIVTVAIVLLFDYTNGFHDAANIVATRSANGAQSLSNAPSHSSPSRTDKLAMP